MKNKDLVKATVAEKLKEIDGILRTAGVRLVSAELTMASILPENDLAVESCGFPLVNLN